MVLILVSMDRGGPYLYTGSKYRGIRHSIKKIQGRGYNKPPSEDVLQKIPREDEGVILEDKFSNCIALLDFVCVCVPQCIPQTALHFERVIFLLQNFSSRRLFFLFSKLGIQPEDTIILAVKHPWQKKQNKTKTKTKNT